MKKITIIALISSLLVSTFAIANEVNIFNARHYKADAGRCGAFQAKGMTQGGLTSPTIKSSVPKNFRTAHWVGVAKRARIIYYSPERVTGAELSGMTYEGLADPKWKGRLVIRKSSNIYNKSLVASLIENNG